MTAENIQNNGDNLTGPFVWSILFHGLLFGSLAASTMFSHRGDLWGGSAGASGAISVKLVGAVTGVPLPKPDDGDASRVVDPTKGLYQSEPPPKAAEPPADATPIPEFTKEKKPRYVTRPSRTLENTAPPPPPNAVPYGQGGSPEVPYTQFTMGTGNGDATRAWVLRAPAAETLPEDFRGTWMRYAAASAATGCKARWIRRCALRRARW